VSRTRLHPTADAAVGAGHLARDATPDRGSFAGMRTSPARCGSGENGPGVAGALRVARRWLGGIPMADTIETPQGLRQPQSPRFRDRPSAGMALADRLTAHRAGPDTMVVGLTNGGMVTAAAIARRLDLPLEIILVRRLWAPGSPRHVLGAIAEGGDPHVDREELWHRNVSTAAVAHEATRQETTLATRRRRLRDGRPLTLPAGGTVLLVDDGLTDGLAAMAAIRALRARGIRRLVLAVPVAPAATVDRLVDMVDELVVLETPLACGAVGGFYEDFRLVPDAEVRGLMASNVAGSRALAHGAC
jgi:putative phosphoribosyl transferase